MYFLRNLLSKIHKPVLKNAPNILPNNDIVEANIRNSADNENKIVQNHTEINNPKDTILVKVNVDIVPKTDNLNKNIYDSKNVNETVEIPNSHEQLFNNTDVSFSNIKNAQDYKIHNSSDCTSTSNSKDTLNSGNSYDINTCGSINLNGQSITENISTIMYSKDNNPEINSHNLEHNQLNELTNKIFSNSKTSNSDGERDLKKIKTDVANVTDVTQNNSVEADDSSTIFLNSQNVAKAIETKSTGYSDNSNDKNNLSNYTLKNLNTDITDETNSLVSLVNNNSIIPHSDFIIDSHLKNKSDNATIGCLEEFENVLTKVQNQNNTLNFAYDYELYLEDNDKISDENTEGDDTYCFQEIKYFNTELMKVNTLLNVQTMRETKNQEALGDEIRLEDNDIICLSSDDDMDGQDPKESIQRTKNTENNPIQYSEINPLNNPLLTDKRSPLNNSELEDQNTLLKKRTKETNNETIFKGYIDEKSLISNDPIHKYDQGSKVVFDTIKNNKFEMKVLGVSTSNDATNIKNSTNLKEITNADDTAIPKPSEEILNIQDTTTLEENNKNKGDIIIPKLLKETVCTNDSTNLKEITNTKCILIQKELEENFVNAENNIHSTNSDTDSDYHSSDFEFITEEEAKLDGFIINFHSKMQVQAPNPRNSNINLKIMRNKDYNILNGPGPSSRKHRRYADKKISKDNTYNENYIVPDGNTVSKVFRDYIPPLSSSEFHLSENKSVRTGAPMLVQYDGIGFDMNIIMKQIDRSEDERYREEADETYKKILEMYPDVNIRRKRRLRRRT